MPIERGPNAPFAWDEWSLGPRPLIKPTVPWVELAAVWGCAMASLYLAVA